MIEMLTAGPQKGQQYPLCGAAIRPYAWLIWAMTRDFKLAESDAAAVFQVTRLRRLEHIDRLEQPTRVGSWLTAKTGGPLLSAVREPGS